MFLYVRTSNILAFNLELFTSFTNFHFRNADLKRKKKESHCSNCEGAPAVCEGNTYTFQFTQTKNETIKILIEYTRRKHRYISSILFFTVNIRRDLIRWAFEMLLGLLLISSP